MDIRERARRGEPMRMTDDVPWYVTNKDSDGFIYRFTVSAWIMVVVPLIVAVNAVVWGTIGLVVGGITVVNAVIDAVNAVVGLF